MRHMTFICCLAIALTFCAPQLAAQCPGGTEYSGTCFPNGNHSFADSVIRYVPDYSFSASTTQPDAAFQDASTALNQPDNVGSDGYVSLGYGGLIELAFVDNVLTNSGNSEPDLRIFEVGSGTGSGTGEWVDVAVRPADAATLAIMMMIGTSTEAGFFDLGDTSTSTQIDLDAIFPGYAAGALRFDAVQIIDIVSQGGGLGGATVGADIDAVGAMNCETTTYRGTHEDIALSSAVNLDAYTADLGTEIKSGIGGSDLYRIRFDSPNGGLDFVPYAVIAQVFSTGSFTGSFNSTVHVNPMAPGLFVVVDSNAFQPFPGLMPAAGIEMAFDLPAFGAGLSVLFQGFALSNLAENNIYATTDAHVIEIL